MKSPKEQRFQLFLHELHDQTCEAAKANGRTLSSEVRHRVKASFEMDANAAKLAELREWADRLTEDFVAGGDVWAVSARLATLKDILDGK